MVSELWLFDITSSLATEQVLSRGPGAVVMRSGRYSLGAPHCLKLLQGSAPCRLTKCPHLDLQNGQNNGPYILPILSILRYWAIILGSFGGPGMYTLLGLQTAMVHGRNFMAHLILKVGASSCSNRTAASPGTRTSQ